MAALAQEEGESSGSLDELLKRADRSLHQARGRTRGLQRELEEARDPQELRDRANLILARLDSIPSGASAVSVQGFGGDSVEIRLDPSLSAHENAQLLYREASRQARAREALPSLLAAAQKEVERLEEIRERLAGGGMTPEEGEALLPAGAEPSPDPGRKLEARRPYRRFRSSGGVEIRVGRKGADNDALTFQHSRPDHIWLHAREMSGAHVILCWAGEGAPPSRDLVEAAALAALNSRARGAGVVPVDWTRRKHVRKPRKAPPGSVVPARVQTLFVEPNPELEKRLEWKE